MHYISYYCSPLGKISLAADNSSLIGLWFEGQKFYCNTLNKNHIESETSIIKQAKNWLDTYFEGKEPEKNLSLPLNPKGSEFQLEVWKILRKIPYGKTVTYGDIAKIIAKQKGLKKMSAQAVGSAIGHNHISIIIPCHRVLGINKKLTGYAGGLDKKAALLNLEGCEFKA